VTPEEIAAKVATTETFPCRGGDTGCGGDPCECRYPDWIVDLGVRSFRLFENASAAWYAELRRREEDQTCPSCEYVDLDEHGMCHECGFTRSDP